MRKKWSLTSRQPMKAKKKKFSFKMSGGKSRAAFSITVYTGDFKQGTEVFPGCFY